MITCPYCDNQGIIEEVVHANNNKTYYVCGECDALWLTKDFDANKGSTVESYMKSLGMTEIAEMWRFKSYKPLYILENADNPCAAYFYSLFNMPKEEVIPFILEVWGRRDEWKKKLEAYFEKATHYDIYSYDIPVYKIVGHKDETKLRIVTDETKEKIVTAYPVK